MRIQHNILAMNAYRNYNTNTSALAKNLEKLSSGYKINRAGDDAAGLAISEKMRAQITGLNAAQKNVKDGISLVKTAEGAMQEIQDMLNRMDYLATQSANGTYDNEVDRKNLQSELDALRTEIDRIADSSNFNGIKLLDGSLDKNATGIGATEAVEGTVSSFTLAAKASNNATGVLGTDTILHTGNANASMTKFAVDLHDTEFENKTGQVYELKIGTNTYTLAGGAHGTAGTALKAADIAAAFAAGEFKDADGNTVAANAVSLTDGTNTGTFTATASGTSIKFEQSASDTAPVNVDPLQVVSGAKVADTPSTTSFNVSEDTAGGATATAVYSFDFDGVTGLSAGNYDVTVGDKTVTITLADGDGAAELATAVKNALNSQFDDGLNGQYATAVTTGGGGANTKVTFTASGNGAITSGNEIGNLTIAANTEGVKGDYNTLTTETVTGVAAGEKRIASTVATLTSGNFADGTVLRIGNKDYTVSTKEADKNAADKVYVGDLNLSSASDLQKAIDRLSVRAASNEVWSVGGVTISGSSAKVTFVEKVNAAGKSYTEQKTGTDGKLADGAFDLTKETGIKASLGTVSGAKAASAGEDGKPLTLQIGDTADSFNQLKVSVGDMHVKAMGKALKEDGKTVDTSVENGGLSISDIKVSNQADAAKAIDVIKRAINYVSGVRGDLGAVQNRLEHTANNLSVMAENIQDAESTIRDTDVAEEMMAYTKNNILVQSAQAMLAQANAVPQGVLQLLG